VFLSVCKCFEVSGCVSGNMVRKFKVMGRSAEEIELFIRLISKHINHIEWGSSNPTDVLPCRRSSSKYHNYQKWKHAWSTVHAQFNASTITMGNVSLILMYFCLFTCVQDSEFISYLLHLFFCHPSRHCTLFSLKYYSKDLTQVSLLFA